MTSARDLCRHCGLTETEHHKFEPQVMPKGCVCDPEDWGVLVPPCSSYIEDEEGRCSRCEHDKECHK